MRIALGLVFLLGCAVHPRTGRPSSRPYKDAPVAVVVAAGAGTAVAVGTAVVVTTAAVGVVVVGAEQFPDPPAGTPPTTTTTAPKDPPNRCRQCLCYKQGVGRSPKGNYRYRKDGGGVEDYTRETCQADCANDGYTGFECAGDKRVTWFN